MASNHTKHLELNQWTGDDNFVRTDFNEDNAKIDVAVAAKAEQSALTALVAEVALKGRLAIGTYQGNDAAIRVIPVGFTPTVVILTNVGGQTQVGSMANYAYGGISITGHNAPGVIIVDGGFRVFTDHNGKLLTNQASYGPYGYIALA